MKVRASFLAKIGPDLIMVCEKELILKARDEYIEWMKQADRTRVSLTFTGDNFVVDGTNLRGIIWEDIP